MRRLVGLAVIGACVLVVRPAAAPPPLGTFPAAVRPAAGDVAPANGRVWIFGTDAPPPAQIGFSVSVEGAPVTATLEAFGCCAVAATLDRPPPGLAHAVVTSPRGDVESFFTVTSSVDGAPPVLTSARVIDDSAPRLVIGADGTDEVALAGFLARAGGQITGAAPPGLLLQATPGTDRCVSVTAIDLAGHESAARTACGAPLDGGVADGGVGRPDAGGGDEAEGCSATRAGSGAPWLALALLLGHRRRRR